MIVPVWVTFLYSRILTQRSGSRRRRRFEFAPLTEPFAVPGITHADILSTVTIEHRDAPLEVIRTRSGVYRPQLNCHCERLAGLQALAEVDPRQLLIGAAEDDEENFYEAEYAKFWLDHPGSIDPDLVAPDEPEATASLNEGRPPPYWRIAEEDVEAARARVQRKLSACVVKDGTLYRPAAAPGLLLILLDGIPAVLDDWMAGVSHGAVPGVFFDASESHLVDRAIRFLGGGADCRIERFPFRSDGEVQGGHLAADATMVRFGIRALVHAAAGSISSLGPDLALLYWSGRRALGRDDPDLFRSWLLEAELAMRRSVHPYVRFYSRLVAARLHALAAQGS